jgi:MFS family permease
MPQPAAQPTPPVAPPAEPARAPRSALLIVFVVVVIDLLGFGIVLPLLPLYGESYVGPLLTAGGSAPATAATAMGLLASPGGYAPLLTAAVLTPARQDWRVGAVVGLLMAAFSAMQFLAAPVWGRISDRVGRRPILLVGLAGSVAFYLLLGYASDLPAFPAASAGLALALLFVARIGAGVAGATIATAQAVIADCTPPERRKQGMALIGAAFGIGFTFGPLVGFASLVWFPGHRGAIGYAAAGLSLVALVLGLALMPETRDFRSPPPLSRKWFDPGAFVAALRAPAIGPVVLTFFLATLGFASFEVTLALLNENVLKLEKRQNFLVFAYVGLVLVLAQGLLYRRLARRVSEPTFMAAGLSLMGLGVACLGVVSWLAVQEQTTFGVLLGLQLTALTVAVVGFAMLTPSAQALISRRTDPGRQGEVLGVNQSAAALARILGPVLGLVLYFATATHLLPYAVGAGLLLLMLPLVPRIRRGG